MLHFLLALLCIQDTPKTGGPFEVNLDKPASRYWLQVPNDYDPTRRYPMVVVLHGAGDTAENFIKVWGPATRTYGWILVAVKSRGQAWDDSDGDLILATMDHVRKTYSIDNERVFLIGYSSGGFMACRFGLKNHAQFRVMCALAGAQEASGKGAKEHLSIFICCGELDGNLPICKSTFKNFQKQGFDSEFKEVPKMEHSPLKQEAIDWVLDRVSSRDLSPADVFRRIKTAEKEKRFGDLIAQLRALVERKPDDKVLKKAEAELARIEKIGDQKLEEAEKKVEKDKEAAKKLFADIARQFAGFECSAKASKRLNELK